MALHSRFGGSSASRWLNCAGSVALLATVPVKPSSAAADEGTWAHAICAYCLEHDIRDASVWEHQALPTHDVPAAYSGRIVGSVPGTIEAIQVYLDAVYAELARTPDAELYVEQGFKLDVATADADEVFGTNDAMVYHPSTGRLVVFDYKHGVGISVDAEDNAQLKFYAAGAVFSNPTWTLSELVLVIVQPRARDVGEEKGVKAWTMQTTDLLEFLGDVETAVGRAKRVEHLMATGQEDPGTFPTLVPGPWCKKTFCDAAAICPAREQAILREAQLDFKDITMVTTADLPDPKTFDTARLGQILAAGQLLSDWLGQIEEYVEALLLAGTPVEGWKVVEKIGRRKFVAADEDIVAHVDMLFDIPEDNVRPRKLTTLTDIEKQMKAAGATKAQIDDFMLKFTIKESSGLTIARASDKREAVNAIAADFGSVKL